MNLHWYRVELIAIAQRLQMLHAHRFIDAIVADAGRIFVLTIFWGWFGRMLFGRPLSWLHIDSSVPSPKISNSLTSTPAKAKNGAKCQIINTVHCSSMAIITRSPQLHHRHRHRSTLRDIEECSTSTNFT
jgi:hypothetical protein